MNSMETKSLKPRTTICMTRLGVKNIKDIWYWCVISKVGLFSMRLQISGCMKTAITLQKSQSGSFLIKPVNACTQPALKETTDEKPAVNEPFFTWVLSVLIVSDLCIYKPF